MAHKKLDTEGLEFETVLADVEELNRNAFAPENIPRPICCSVLFFLQ